MSQKGDLLLRSTPWHVLLRTRLTLYHGIALLLWKSVRNERYCWHSWKNATQKIQQYRGGLQAMTFVEALSALIARPTFV